MSIAQLYDRARDESLSEAERDLARRQAEAETHNHCFYTGPGQLERDTRDASRTVFCPCGDYRDHCGHPAGYGAGDLSLRRCERHGGRSQTECDVYERVTE